MILEKNGTKGSPVLLLTLLSTDPSSLAVHVNAADVLCQVRAAAEVLQTEVPAAGVRHRLSSRGGRTTLTVHHGRGRPAAGHRALHLHQGTADTERERESKRES